MQKIIESLWHKYQAEIVKNQGELEILVNKPSGIGDHTCFADEIDKKIKAISDNQGYLFVLQETFGTQLGDDEPELELENTPEEE